MSLVRRWQAIDRADQEAAVRSARERAGVPDVRQRSFWESRDPVARAAILAEADADRGRPWPHTLVSDYARYWRDGVRTAYEGPAGELRRRTSAAVLAAALTGEQQHVDVAADGLLLLCEQTTWCWAAHESFATAKREVVARPDQPYLDLGAAETVGILAWADLVLAPALDERVPGLRRRMREEARHRVLRPFVADRTWHWLGLDGHVHNWNPWIHGQVLAAALFLETDPVVQTQVLGLVVEGLDRYLRSLPADGGCDEGYAYWWHGPARLASALELLDRITGGGFGPWSCAPLIELARYPQRMALGDGWYVNVGDGSGRPAVRQPWQVLHQWGRRIEDPEVMSHAAAYRGEALAIELGLGRALWALADDGWWAATAGSPPLPRSTLLPDVELLVAREFAASTEGWALAIKGGHNDENHNHNDVGSFIAALDGTPVLIDLGQPTYTAVSFSDRRYEQWVVRSEWHNVPVIGGHQQQPGARHRATGFVVRRDAAAELAELFLSEAYPGGNLHRAATLDREAAMIRVVDTWTGSLPVVEHLVIAGQPVVHDAGRLVVETLGGRHAQLSWDEDLGPGRLEQREVDDELLAVVWGPMVHRLVLTTSPSAQKFELTLTRFQEPAQ
ncbi:heparinase II/III domain-containing protein [Kribbella sp. CA-293567]|uniref:heparinase II/III domain-containing protein n=1 Tax=Kribbella sp. CA-293567 TaxID=3002436 RepID=UPI0022DE0CF8|nr:heparinase II/III family protein [Kribbella sp. CA-293567]WBQ08352.1 heparinase II/III family protein [Kribbella sp. CA-293567]